MSSGTLRWIGWLACAVWLALGINYEILQQDPNQYGFRAVQGELKNCAGDDVKSRYECKEKAIDANQQMLFLKEMGRFALILAPPILVWWASRKLLRKQNDEDRLPPSIQKWRVK